jgi:hypothetical protein
MGGFATIGTAAAMMLWAFVGNAVLPGISSALQEKGTAARSRSASCARPDASTCEKACHRGLK